MSLHEEKSAKQLVKAKGSAQPKAKKLPWKKLVKEEIATFFPEVAESFNGNHSFHDAFTFLFPHIEKEYNALVALDGKGKVSEVTLRMVVSKAYANSGLVAKVGDKPRSKNDFGGKSKCSLFRKMDISKDRDLDGDNEHFEVG